MGAASAHTCSGSAAWSFLPRASPEQPSHPSQGTENPIHESLYPAAWEDPLEREIGPRNGSALRTSHRTQGSPGHRLPSHSELGVQPLAWAPPTGLPEGPIILQNVDQPDLQGSKDSQI